MFEALTPEDVYDIVSKLVSLAKSGGVAAAKVVLDRGIGKVPEDVLLNVRQDDSHSANARFL